MEKKATLKSKLSKIRSLDSSIIQGDATEFWFNAIFGTILCREEMEIIRTKNFTFTVCHNAKTVVETIYFLELPYVGYISMQDIINLLNEYLSIEVMDGHNKKKCEICKMKTKTVVKTDLKKGEKKKFLIITWCRKQINQNGKFYKNSLQIKMEIGLYFMDNLWKLSGFLEHLGNNFASGHYIANIFYSEDNYLFTNKNILWNFNDLMVSQVKKHSLIS